MFKIKAYGKSEFAWMMFPKMRNPSAAQDKLLRWIKKDPRFHKKILRLATTKDDNNYSKEQIQLMVDKWGDQENMMIFNVSSVICRHLPRSAVLCRHWLIPNVVPL